MIYVFEKFRIDKSCGCAHDPAMNAMQNSELDQRVSEHLTRGGDDRLHLNGSGVNKYYCAPRSNDGDAIVRGSCTCSSPTPDGFRAASELLQAIENRHVTFENAMKDVAKRISTVMHVDVPHEVIIHPSGSDAELIPLAIAQAKAERLGSGGIINIVVAAGEVGSGTAAASGGKHFSKFAPDGTTVELGGLADGFAATTEVIELKPRLPCGSRNENFDDLVQDACGKAKAKFANPFIVLHAVDGSKTGLRLPSKDLIEELQKQYGDSSLVCMDACQNRSEPEETNWFLRRGASVLVTASKFFEAPGFCGAVLVPKSDAAVLDAWENFPDGMASYITAHDIPLSMQNLRNKLPNSKNVGLLLRWAAGIREMELFDEKREACTRAISAWVSSVRVLVRNRAPQLEVVDAKYKTEDGDATRLGGVNSVVSIRFLDPTDKSRYLDATILRKMHKLLTINCEKMLSAGATVHNRKAASQRCMVGQPVALGDFGVLRLAIGAELSRRIAAGDIEEEIRKDELILDKMCVLAKFIFDIVED